MRGLRAKILRKQAAKLTIGRPLRRQEVVKLAPRTRWVALPATTLFERLLQFLGKKPRMEKRTVVPTVVREQRGTMRWAYKRLKRIYYRLKAA